MKEYFVYNKHNWDFDFFETEQEAKEATEDYIEHYREEASDEGWPDLSGLIGYGKSIASTVEEVIEEKEDYTDEEWEEKGYSLDHNKIVDYKLKEDVSNVEQDNQVTGGKQL